MHLKTTSLKQYAFLPSGILIVEPDPELLYARTLLLMAADRYQSVAHAEAAGTAMLHVALRIAALSQTLGPARLSALAYEVRLYWPDARILIIGQDGLTLDETLYDDSIELHCRPEELLAALFRLERDQGKRTVFQQPRIGIAPLRLCGFSSHSLARFRGSGVIV